MLVFGIVKSGNERIGS
jgi:hypothetical protein